MQTVLLLLAKMSCAREKRYNNCFDTSVMKKLNEDLKGKNNACIIRNKSGMNRFVDIELPLSHFQGRGVNA
jgi:hypothetical protein